MLDDGYPVEGYPVRVRVEHPQRLSRLLIFVKWLLAFPHYIVLYVLQIVAFVVIVIAWFAVLITGRYPRALFDFIVGVERWRLRLTAYVFLQTDIYPPFTLSDDASYPATLEVDYPEHIARWRPLVNWLLAIPVWLIALGFELVAMFAVLIAWFAILITGRFPESLFNLVTSAWRWAYKATLYSLFVTGEYPL